MSETAVRQTKTGKPVTYYGMNGRRTATLDKEWEVVRDGEVLGRIKRSLASREKKTPGRTYVDRRWQTPAWLYCLSGEFRWVEAYTKGDAFDAIVRQTDKH